MITAIRPGSQLLFDVAGLATELGLSGADAVLLADRADRICGEIESVLDWGPIGRQRYREMAAGADDAMLLLSRHPIDKGAPIVATQRSVAVTGYALQSDLEALLYRESGWSSETPWAVDLTETRMLGMAKRDLRIEYSAGWVVPGEGLRDSAGKPVLQLELVDPVSIGDTAVTLGATSLTGSIAPPWGLMLDGSDLLYVVTAAATAADNELVVTVAAYIDQTTAAESAGVDVDLEAGTSALPLVEYLPRDIEGFARRATSAAWARERKGRDAFESVRAGETAVTFAKLTKSMIEHELADYQRAA